MLPGVPDHRERNPLNAQDAQRRLAGQDLRGVGSLTVQPVRDLYRSEAHSPSAVSARRNTVRKNTNKLEAASTAKNRDV